MQSKQHTSSPSVSAAERREVSAGATQASQWLSCELPPAGGAAAAAALCASPTACERGSCLAESKPCAPAALTLLALLVTPACATHYENLYQQDVWRCKQSLSLGVSGLRRKGGSTSAASKRTATPSSLLMSSSNLPPPSINRPFEHLAISTTRYCFRCRNSSSGGRAFGRRGGLLGCWFVFLAC